MNLKRHSERDFIRGIARRFGRLAPPAPAGIGDDAALLAKTAAGRLVSTDCLIEGLHFRRDEPAYLLGRKSLAVNLSDIAAMGGRPEAFLLTLAIPRDLPSRYIDLFLDGLASAARLSPVSLVGGDTSGSPGPLVISITIFGRTGTARGRALLTRGGARPGDGLYVSGPMGGSAAGRTLLDRGWRPRPGRGERTIAGVMPPARRAILPGAERRRLMTRATEALRQHLDPTPRVSLGRALLDDRIASAAIDLSDGLSTDLSRLCDASRTGARIVAPAIPIADTARALGLLLKVDPLELALHGGEDYELLFSVPPSRQRLMSSLPAVLIGRITSRERGLCLASANGQEKPLKPRGWDHLARSGRIPLTSRK